MEPLCGPGANASQDQKAIGLIIFSDNSALVAGSTHCNDGHHSHGLKAMTVIPRLYKVAPTAPRLKGDIPELKEGRQRQIKVMSPIPGFGLGGLRIGGVEVQWTRKLARPHDRGAEQTGDLWFSEDCGVPSHARILLARLHAEMLAAFAADGAAPMPIRPSVGGRPGHDWPLGMAWTTWTPEEAALINARLNAVVNILTEDCQYNRIGLRMHLIAGKPCDLANPASGAFTRPHIKPWMPKDWSGPSNADLTKEAEKLFFQATWERNLFFGQDYCWSSKTAAGPLVIPGPASSAQVSSSIWRPVSRHQSMAMRRSLIHDPCPISRERIARITSAAPHTVL